MTCRHRESNPEAFVFVFTPEPKPWSCWMDSKQESSGLSRLPQWEEEEEEREEEEREEKEREEEREEECRRASGCRAGEIMADISVQRRVAEPQSTAGEQ